MNRLTASLNRSTASVNRSTASVNRSTASVNRSTASVNRLTALAVVLTFALVPACKKDEPKKEAVDKSAKVEQKPAKEKPKKRPRVAPLAPDEPRTKLGDFPVSAELEEEADRTVAIENLEAELDRLEAEIIGLPK